MTKEEAPIRTLRHVMKIEVETALYRLGRWFRPPLRAEQVTPEAAEAIEKCIHWLRTYIGQPHPQLGRKGDICPFVVTALNRRRMSFHVYDNVTSISARRLKNLLVYEGLRLRKRLNHDDHEMELTTVNILLPNLNEAEYQVMHDAHTLCKTILMRRGLMISVFFPGYTRPGIYNPDFHLYQSPYPIFTIRPMALHDIVFLDRNLYAFLEYRRRYGTKYAAGKVPEKYGYIERYAEAEKRFSLR